MDKWGKWLSFDGACWRSDETLFAFDRVRKICRLAATAQCKDPRVAKALASASTVAGVSKLARSDRRLAATTDQWDCDPWLLNTPGGVIDQRTGESRPHRVEDYITKITTVTPDLSYPTPTWSKFLDRVTGGDKALIGFLQRMAGYALTGETREHALFFLYGTGGNGKGTFVNALCGCVDDYHRSAPMDAFTETRYERHPTDLAGFRGARLVTGVETEEGRHWAESKIKTLTGGDKISARIMRQDFFEYWPQFKLLIMATTDPASDQLTKLSGAASTSFRSTLPSPRRSAIQLDDKLKEEWPGILAWMIQGCLDWQKHGLASPDPLASATAAYLEAEDTHAAWMAECCIQDPDARERVSDLFASWSEWAKEAGESVGSQRSFSERLEAHGVRRWRRRDARGFIGLRLLGVPG